MIYYATVNGVYYPLKHQQTSFPLAIPQVKGSNGFDRRMLVLFWGLREQQREWIQPVDRVIEIGSLQSIGERLFEACRHCGQLSPLPSYAPRRTSPECMIRSLVCT